MIPLIITSMREPKFEGNKQRTVQMQPGKMDVGPYKSPSPSEKVQYKHWGKTSNAPANN